jgi:hypothetical protein
MFFQIWTLVVFLILSVEFDYWRIKNKRKIDHNVNAAFRIIIGIAVLQDYFHLAIFLSSWWILFDLFLNLRRGLPWDYIGTEAELDKLLRKVKINQFVVKLLVLAISILLYTLLRDNF